MLACVIFGALAGVFAGIFALAQGLSFGVAFSIYFGVSAFAMVGVPLICLAIRRVLCWLRHGASGLQARWLD